jgi:nucleoside-diphosphate-sugar epimerase
MNALLVYYSIHYVFDGAKKDPSLEEDSPNPLNVYGASKLAGEGNIERAGALHLIFVGTGGPAVVAPDRAPQQGGAPGLADAARSRCVGGGAQFKNLGKSEEVEDAQIKALHEFQQQNPDAWHTASGIKA